MSKNEKKLKWYDSGEVITTLIIITVVLAIICSQSFAVGGKSSFTLFSSIINHNTIYALVLIYFILLKTRLGRKYFNYLNIFLVFIYFIATITSILTLVQSLGLTTIITFFLNLVFLIYLVHTMFRDTRIWKELELGDSPFNEISNDVYFYIIVLLIVFNLVVNLISTVVVSGLLISVLDAFYFLLLGRYIYLYCLYLDVHKLDVDNEGNFDEIKKNISNELDDVANKIKDVSQELLDKTDIDEKIKDKINDLKTKDNNSQKKREDKIPTKKKSNKKRDEE